MKSEPDRLDFLIVVLPLILIGVLGFQLYQYFQVDHDLVLNLPMNVGNPELGPQEMVPEEAPAQPQDLGATPAAGEEQPQEQEPDAAAETPPAVTPGAASDTESAEPDAEPEGGPPVAAEPPADVATGSPGSEAGNDSAEPESPGNPAGDVAPAPPVDSAEPLANAGAAPPLQDGASGPVGAAAVPPGAGQPVESSGQPDEGSSPVVGASAAAPQEDIPRAPEAPWDTGEMQVYFDPPAIPTRVGDAVALEIRIRNAEAVAAAVFHLIYDTTRLQLDEPHAELGPFLADPAGMTRLVANPTPASGRIVTGINMIRGVEGRSGSGLLVTFRFRAVAPGPAMFRFVNASLRGSRNEALTAVFTDPILEIAE